ncbi:MAG: hypothetical protein AB7O66_19090 [Limisphaerales bacterium]
MKTLTRILTLTAAVASLVAVSPNTLAQQNPGGGRGQRGGGGGGFDPAQMQERLMTMYRERLEITSDDEWKAIQPLVAKVGEARREVGTGFGRNLFRPPGGGRGGDQGGGGGGGGGNGGRRGGFGGEPSAEEAALEKAIESKASAADIKTALAKLRDSKKAKEAKLAEAQENLRKVLTVRQEAQAVLAGLLN